MWPLSNFCSENGIFRLFQSSRSYTLPDMIENSIGATLSSAPTVFRQSEAKMPYPILRREMFSSSPTAPISTAIDVPPALKKGSGWPVVGMSPVTTAMFIIA